MAVSVTSFKILCITLTFASASASPESVSYSIMENKAVVSSDNSLHMTVKSHLQCSRECSTRKKCFGYNYKDGNCELVLNPNYGGYIEDKNGTKHGKKLGETEDPCDVISATAQNNQTDARCQFPFTDNDGIIRHKCIRNTGRNLNAAACRTVGGGWAKCVYRKATIWSAHGVPCQFPFNIELPGRIVEHRYCTSHANDKHIWCAETEHFRFVNDKLVEGKDGVCLLPSCVYNYPP